MTDFWLAGAWSVRDSRAGLGTDAPTDFDALWGALTPAEQARLLALLIEVVGYDGRHRTVSVRFRHTAIRGLGERRLGDAA